MSSSDVPAALALDRISKTFRGNVQAVRDVSLRIEQGEIVALLGPNGAGKTTLIDIALGLQAPDTGTAQILGMAPAHAISRGLVGAVNQSGGLPVDLRVKQLLGLISGFYDRPLPMEQVVEATHLQQLLSRKVGKLSGGEQQRVRLALALLPDPLVLFLDEPTSGMDPEARREFWRVMQQAAGGGRTIVFATHYLAEAESFARRTVIMRDGRIAADAPTAELMQRGQAVLRVGIPRDSLPELTIALGRDDLEFSWDQGTLTVTGTGLDDVARRVLALPEAANLRIADSSLEDVFSLIALDHSDLEEVAR